MSPMLFSLLICLILISLPIGLNAENNATIECYNCDGDGCEDHFEKKGKITCPKGDSCYKRKTEDKDGKYTVIRLCWHETPDEDYCIKRKKPDISDICICTKPLCNAAPHTARAASALGPLLFTAAALVYIIS